MTYTTIKSKFVNEELKKTKWKKRNYIDDLIYIEGFVLKQHFGLWGGYLRNHLLGKYPRQWKAIWLELNPKEYRKDVEFEKKERERKRKEEARLKREEALELKRDRLEWKKRGGKI